MTRHRSQHLPPVATALILITLSLAFPIGARAGTLDVTVVYQGPGQVDADHGLMVFVFGGNDFGNPANPILATRYLGANHTTVKFSDLDAETVWVMAVYDEAGGYSVGPLPGPFGFYSETPGGPPAGVRVGGEGIELRFADSNRVPVPADAEPRASFEALQGAGGGIVEIRTYRVKPGMREEFVRFFEKTLAAQAEVGLRVPGQFRSLDDENTFVWIRAFRDQKERQEQSRAFYFGPAWLGERQQEAVRLIESAEVMLLEPTARSLIR